MKIFENSKLSTIFFNKNLGKSQLYTGFTLSEVLITLGVIGVIAAITIPTLMNSAQDLEYKTAYKKAYSDLSQAFVIAISEQSLTPRISWFDNTATASEWDVIKNAFKISKECTPAQLNNCWGIGEKLFISEPSTSSYSFVDPAGRSWAQYDSAENIYLVDTNGQKLPNRYGKDRWLFTLFDEKNIRIMSGLPAKVGPGFNYDITSKDINVCNYPPCNYKSWLYK